MARANSFSYNLIRLRALLDKSESLDLEVYRLFDTVHSLLSSALVEAERQVEFLSPSEYESARKLAEELILSQQGGDKEKGKPSDKVSRGDYL